MTVLRGYHTLEQAYLEKSRLAAEGIAADVLDEGTAVSAPYLLAGSGIRLAVADEDAARAREILGLPERPPLRAPENVRKLWMILAILGLVVLLLSYGIRHRDAKPADVAVVEQDRNGDGRPDARYEYDRAGNPIRGFEDDNFDGRWDTRFHFERGLVRTAGLDLDFDGAFDSVFEYRHGIPVLEIVRPGGTGHPLFRREMSNNRLVVEWIDRDRDGAWDERVRYDSMGRELERVPFR
jgi:hypothetical protein